VPYLETIKGRAEHVEGKLKKQSGGRGQFGVCFLTVEPGERGSGVDFLDEIVGGSIPRQFIPAVEKGVRERCLQGVIAGYPVTDIKVHCTDGKHHAVDSSEMAFRTAGSLGMREAFALAKPTLLEPIMEMEVSVPDDFVGDVMGNLNSRRGRVAGVDARGSTQSIKAQVPMAEVLTYASDLTSITGGQGAFTMEFSHYAEVPRENQEKVIAEANAAKEE
jgi:elongation factor G